MGRVISEDEFGQLLAEPASSAFRLETLDAYALGYERADFERYLAGNPVPPSEADWWRPWLDQIARLTAQGVTVSRVRILAEPPTDYQRWMLWADHWHAAAGERIEYLPRSRAAVIGLPLPYDWWLLDDTRLIMMQFTSAGEIDHKILTDDPRIVSAHREWRDLAVRNATPAENIAAA